MMTNKPLNKTIPEITKTINMGLKLSIISEKEP